jgi:hypothetical protein
MYRRWLQLCVQRIDFDLLWSLRYATLRLLARRRSNAGRYRVSRRHRHQDAGGRHSAPTGRHDHTAGRHAGGRHTDDADRAISAPPAICAAPRRLTTTAPEVSTTRRDLDVDWDYAERLEVLAEGYRQWRLKGDLGSCKSQVQLEICTLGA